MGLTPLKNSLSLPSELSLSSDEVEANQITIPIIIKHKISEAKAIVRDALRYAPE